MPVILDWQVPRVSRAMGSGKENGPGSVWPACLRYWGIWRLGIGEGRCSWEGEGTSDLLLRGCPGRSAGAHVISLLFPPSQGCPGWKLTGGGIEWIAHFLNIFQNPDRWVEIMYSSADERCDHAAGVLELAPEASGSASQDSKVRVLPLSLPVHHQTSGRATLFLCLPRLSFLKSCTLPPAPYVTSYRVTSLIASDVDKFSWYVLL